MLIVLGGSWSEYTKHVCMRFKPEHSLYTLWTCVHTFQWKSEHWLNDSLCAISTKHRALTSIILGISTAFHWSSSQSINRLFIVCCIGENSNVKRFNLLNCNCKWYELLQILYVCACVCMQLKVLVNFKLWWHQSQRILLHSSFKCFIGLLHRIRKEKVKIVYFCFPISFTFCEWAHCYAESLIASQMCYNINTQI